MVHRVWWEERAIIPLCISEMKIGCGIASGRTQLLFYLANYVKNLFHCKCAIWSSAIRWFTLSFHKSIRSFLRDKCFCLYLFPLWSVFLPPQPTTSVKPLYLTLLHSASQIPVSVIRGWRRWVMWCPWWSLLFPLPQLPTPLQPLTNHPGFWIEWVKWTPPRRRLESF